MNIEEFKEILIDYLPKDIYQEISKATITLIFNAFSEHLQTIKDYKQNKKFWVNRPFIVIAFYEWVKSGEILKL